MSSYKSSSMPQRSSPFRRPASPSSPATNNRPNTPPSTASRTAQSPMTSPSKLKHSYTVSEEEEEEESLILTPTKSNGDIAPILRAPSPSPTAVRRLPSPPKQQQQTSYQSSRSPVSSFAMQAGGTDALSKLPPQLLNSLRESFSVLDSSSTGTITPSSVHETLQSLGLSTTEINQLFPPGQAQQIALPQYLNSLASVLVALSPQQELLNAFSAFDDDDSGQIDIAELRHALINTPPDADERALTEKDVDAALAGFTGRRILGKNAISMPGLRGPNAPTVNRKGGEVFRYQEFVGNLTGGPLNGQQQGQPVPTR